VINADRRVRDVFCFGASAGGLQAMITVLDRLPASLPATLALVLHRSPTFNSHLVHLLSHHTELPVREPADGEPIRPGHIYVAPRDVHLTADRKTWRLVRGAKVHWARPAVDPLFASLADGYGARCVGILLSGGGVDGVAGLIAIKAAGGLSIAQDPVEARDPSMPVRAIHEDDVDAILGAEQIAAALPIIAAGAPFPISPRQSLLPADG
jgi:two-component system, chemotaxis family, protein-glutamate methylesterase/glutaminase